MRTVRQDSAGRMASVQARNGQPCRQNKREGAHGETNKHDSKKHVHQHDNSRNPDGVHLDGQVINVERQQHEKQGREIQTCQDRLQGKTERQAD